jgi:signal transduction histidine kinase
MRAYAVRQRRINLEAEGEDPNLGYGRAMPVVSRLRTHPMAVDAIVAALLAVVAFVSVHASLQLAGKDLPGRVEPGDPRMIAALLIITLPLAFRRRFPLTVAAVVIGGFMVGRLTLPTEFEEPFVSVWAVYLALYSAARYSQSGRWAMAGVGVLFLVVIGEIVREILFAGDLPAGTPLARWFLFFYNVAVLFLPVILGFAVRSSHARQRQLGAQAVELKREREENARRAVLEERVRIARELHDVVAHHVSVMGIQAGAARRIVDTRPDKVEEVLGMIESSSREAVVELHRLLGFLRRADQTDGMAPQPDLKQLGDLVASARKGDLAVELVVDGRPRTLPPTVELSAYRVIQEALTNALKHSHAETATVRIDYGSDLLEVEVVDDGRGPPRSRGATSVGGHGLIGMRERVRLHGGHLRTGSGPTGGFAVHATFPLDRQAP